MDYPYLPILEVSVKATPWSLSPSQRPATHAFLLEPISNGVRKEILSGQSPHQVSNQNIYKPWAMPSHNAHAWMKGIPPFSGCFPRSCSISLFSFFQDPSSFLPKFSMWFFFGSVSQWEFHWWCLLLRYGRKCCSLHSRFVFTKNSMFFEVPWSVTSFLLEHQTWLILVQNKNFLPQSFP